MGEPVTFKPIIWRLVLQNFLPYYVGWVSVSLINRAIKHYPDLLLIFFSGIVVLIMSIIFSVVFRKKYCIVISDGKINGPGVTIWNRKSFSIADLDMSTLYKQSFYEKTSGFHTLRSVDGQKIFILNFIYGKPAVNELYKNLEKYHSQPINS